MLSSSVEQRQGTVDTQYELSSQRHTATSCITVQYQCNDDDNDDINDNDGDDDMSISVVQNIPQLCSLQFRQICLSLTVKSTKTLMQNDRKQHHNMF